MCAWRDGKGVKVRVEDKGKFVSEEKSKMTVRVRVRV